MKEVEKEWDSGILDIASSSKIEAFRNSKPRYQSVFAIKVRLNNITYFFHFRNCKFVVILPF